MKVSIFVFVLIIFVATAVWDVLLRIVVQGTEGQKFAIIARFKFLGLDSQGRVFPIMRRYFRERSVLAAAFFAGLVGALAVGIVGLLSFIFCDQFGLRPGFKAGYILWVVLVSGLVGLLMKYTNYAPPLAATYYSQPVYITFFLDCLSGAMVLLPILPFVQPREQDGERCYACAEY